MRGAVLHAPGDIRVEERQDPTIERPSDVVIRLVATCVCGSDLRAQARAQLRSGELSPIDVLRAPHESPAGDLRVEQLLVSLPGIGKARATALLTTAGIPPTRRVRSLGTRQQEALADALHR